MQLSNQPAEQLANHLIARSNGAFALCGFVSGGMSLSQIYVDRANPIAFLGTEAMESVIKLAIQVGIRFITPCLFLAELIT